MFGRTEADKINSQLKLKASIVGFKYDKGTVTYKRVSANVIGCAAEITGNSIGSKITATRVLLLGPIGLLAKKTTGSAFLLIQGEGADFAIKVESKNLEKATEFVVMFNQLQRSLVA